MIEELYEKSKSSLRVKFYKKTQLDTFHVNASVHVLFFQYHSYSLRHKKTVSPPLTYVPNIIITDRRSLLYLCTWFRFFGCLVYKFPPIVANDVKHVSPILHSTGIIAFAWFIILPKFCQYFIVGISPIETSINVSTYLANAIIHGCCKFAWPFWPE